jgi:hypothetical protein
MNGVVISASLHLSDRSIKMHLQDTKQEKMRTYNHVLTGIWTRNQTARVFQARALTVPRIADTCGRLRNLALTAPWEGEVDRQQIN